MSESIYIAINQRLGGSNAYGEVISPVAYPCGAAAQTTLRGLLDADTSELCGLAIYKGNQKDNAAPSGKRRAITYRITTGSPDRRFGVQSGIIEDVYVSMEYWSPRDSDIANIHNAVETLLDNRKLCNATGNRAAPFLPLQDGTCLWSEAHLPLQEDWNPNSKLFTGLVRWSLKEWR